MTITEQDYNELSLKQLDVIYERLKVLKVKNDPFLNDLLIKVENIVKDNDRNTQVTPKTDLLMCLSCLKRHFLNVYVYEEQLPQAVRHFTLEELQDIVRKIYYLEEEELNAKDNNK